MTEYYRCSYLLIFAMLPWWILTSTSYPICFFSLYCSTWLLHTQAKTNTVSLYYFFWVTHWCLNFICRRFGTLCLFLLPAYTAYEARTDREFWNVRKYTSEDGESLKRKNTTFRRWRKFEIKKHSLLLCLHSQFVLHSNNHTLQSVYPPHVWNSIICTKDSNLNYELTHLEILTLLQFGCFL
jgi:hypothetical protein